MTLPVLDIQNLQKEYRGRTPVFSALLPRLTLLPGAVTGITGPSGCGKSTLLEMLALLSPPSQAQRFVLHAAGREYDLADLWARRPEALAPLRRTHLGFVHQGGGLYPFLTVRQNIALPLALNQSGAAPALQARVEDLLHFLGLAPVAHALPENLSYGERQRVAVARALIHKPQLILADEPTSALDPDTARTTIDLLQEGARDAGAALVVVSHDHHLLEAAGMPVLSMRAVLPSSPGEVRYALEPSAGVPASCLEARPVMPQANAGARRVGIDLRPLLFLTWKDWRYERALSLCAVLAFAAALMPLLLLGSLRTGLVESLSQRVLHNPAALAVNPLGSQRYTEQDMAALRALPQVAFLVPRTRTLASTVGIALSGQRVASADAVPTAMGDPLLTRYASVPPEGSAVLSHQLARSLPGVRPGDTVELLVSRRVNARIEQAQLPVRVYAVLPDAADGKAHIYLHHTLLLDMERYRDGYAVPRLNWPGRAGKEAVSYAGFRMYVRTLDDVVTVRDALHSRGIEAYTFAREVESIIQMRQALTRIVALVGGITLAGMALSLSSLAVGNVRRKVRLFAQCALMGLGRAEVLSLPLLHMVFTAVLACTCSLLLYAAAAPVLDWLAAAWLGAGEYACRLSAAQVGALYLGALLLACICGIGASWQVWALQPAEVLRRE